MRTNKKILDELLELAGEDELKSIVRKYAKSNKDFLFFLQLKFLHLLPTDEPGKKYGSFLSNSFRYWLDRPDKINITAVRKIKLYSEELRQQCLDMISLKNFIEAYGIIKNLLFYNSLLIEKTWPESPEELLELHREILITYHRLAEQKLARPLRQELIQDLQSLLTSGSVKIFNNAFNAMNLLSEVLYKEGKSESFFREFFEYLIHQPPKSTLTTTAVYSFLINTGTYSSENWAEKLYSARLLSSTQLYEQCELWLKEEKLMAASKLAAKAIEFVAAGSKGTFFEILCRIKLADGKTKEGTNDFFAFVTDANTTAQMVEKSIRDLPDEFRSELRKSYSAESVIGKLESKKEKLSTAHLLAWLDYSEELLQLAEQYNSTYLVMPFNKMLYNKNPDLLKAFYIRYIEDYLENHIGKMSIHFTSNLLENIRKSGIPKLADQISRHISEKFSYRISVTNL